METPKIPVTDEWWYPLAMYETEMLTFRPELTRLMNEYLLNLKAFNEDNNTQIEPPCFLLN